VKKPKVTITGDGVPSVKSKDVLQTAQYKKQSQAIKKMRKVIIS